MKPFFTNLSKVVVLVTIFLIYGCNNDSENATPTGQTEFKMTDSPLNDVNVSGVYVTVSNIKVDGVAIPDFKRQTINLNDYENGTTASLATAILLAKTHNNLTLVLDTEKDEDGHFPGCFVTTTTEDKKYPLRSGVEMDLIINNEWTVASNSKSSIVLDFDIRKAVIYVENSETRFAFASKEILASSIRILNQEEAGAIDGTFHPINDSIARKILVYAYRVGTFNYQIETQPQGGDGVLFRNAVTSSELISTNRLNTFMLDFLKAGDYEVYFASYEMNVNNFTSFKGIVHSTITSGESSSNVVTVPAGWPASVIVMETPED